MKPIKILYLDQGDFIGGAELYSLDLFSHLNKKHFQLTVATSNNQDYIKQIKKLNIPTKTIPFPQASLFHIIKFLKAANRLKKLIQKTKPNIIHSNSVRGHLLSFIANLMNTTPMIWMIHDFTFLFPFPFLTCWKPKTILANSKAVRTSLKKKIIYPKQINIFNNGLDFDKLNKIKPLNIKKEFKLKDDSQTIGIVGLLIPWKGQKTFIHAAEIVLKQNPQARFFIVGESNKTPQSQRFEQQLKTWIQKHNLSKQIIFTGFRQDALPFIAGLDILIHASNTPEPFGRTIVEAQALHTAVIASNQGGPREIIQNGINGILIKPNNPQKLANTITRLLQNPKLKNSLETEAVKTARKNYNLKSCTKTIEDTWKQF